MKHTSLAIFAALVCTSTPFAMSQALAQQADASSPSTQLDRFVGSGTCTGNMMAMGKNPGHATTGKFQAEKTLDGHWVVIKYDEERTAVNSKPFSVVQYIGYDNAGKRYVSVLVDNSEAGYSTGTSAGWKGDSITFDESMDGKPASFRDIFTSGESGLASHTGMERGKDGKWVKTDEETCHKA